ncbi:ABC transporter ATP-binding protein [Streptacidiphilus sp. P02-A3a]|uniref:ABC transporter ATP-binding protein n=1 Tax=Streptacidiphilus sp. P02-A3a TaxID=2704468 RepID=UPI0015F791A1|nr:ABC transporter ATP-binding protein [Streptacidiphilus sp. P02-A3a]QMU71085.1 ABC transporter ATP-binding protein [Streptacidiphilus sp. P02-A3a]
MTARLSVENLSKSFGRARVLDRVSFTVQPGRFLVLLGPSGSGKTTLLRCLAGIERADSGSIHLGDLPLAHERTHLPPDRRDLAMVFQDYALWPHMTADANVGYALRRRRLDKETSRRRVDRVLERVGLGDHAAQYPHQLSGGQQQRVALARALVAEPGLLLFDEPLSNLDADLRERLRVEIATLTRESGATVVYITHDQAEAFALADEIGVLEGGDLVQLGSPEDVYHRPASPFVARFTGLAGELAGELAPGRTAPGTVLVRTGAGVVTAAAGAGLPAGGGAVRVLIRPAAVTLARDPGGADGDPAATGPAGTVVDTAYRGRGYDHVVELPGGVRLTGVFDRDPHPRGTRVHLLLDPDGCFAFADKRPGATERTSPANAAGPTPIRTTLEV